MESECVGSDEPKFQMCPSPVSEFSPAQHCYYEYSQEAFCYSIEVLESAGYLALLLWVIVRNVRLKKFRLELLTLALYAAFSFAKAFAHVVTGYNCLPDPLKQFLFVLPLLFLFYVYGVIVFQWLGVLQSEKNTSRPALILSASMCSVATVFVIITYILYCVNWGQDDSTEGEEENGNSRMAVVGSTNIGLAILYITHTIAFCIMGGKIASGLYKLSKSTVYNTSSVAIKKVFALTIGASISFLAYGSCLLWEGSEILINGFFYYMISNEYTAPGWLELLYFLFQITPALILMAITGMPRKTGIVEQMSLSDDSVGDDDDFDSFGEVR